MSEAPSRIWIDPDWNRHPYWESFPIGNMSEYIRADIVEEMREALEKTAELVEILGHRAVKARSALKRLEEE